MKGEELKFLREYLGMNQLEFAEELGKSQKTISLWEMSDDLPLKSDLEEKLKKMLKDRKPDEMERLDHLPLISREYSWSEKVFDLLVKEWSAKGRPIIQKVIVRATIKPAQDNTIRGVKVPSDLKDRYADCTIDIEYIGLDLGSEPNLYIDHLGNEEGPFSKVPPPSSVTTQDDTLSQTENQIKETIPVPLDISIEAFPALCTLDRTVRQEIGQHVVAYNLSGVNKNFPIKATIDAKYGLKRFDKEFIGFPVYADILIHQLYIEVCFTEGLQPDNCVVSSQALVVRRTKFKPQDLKPDFTERDVEKTDDNRLIYRFGPLVRPRGGYFYCLSWNKIEGPKNHTS